MSKRMTIQEFIEKAKMIHGDKYDYSLVMFKNNKNIIKIICPIHGIFKQCLSAHIHQGSGCSICSKNKKMTTVEFIKKAEYIHGNNFDYSNVKYINSKTKVCLKCNNCEEIIYQEPTSHLSGVGCSNCNKNKKMNIEQKLKEFFDENQD